MFPNPFPLNYSGISFRSFSVLHFTLNLNHSIKWFHSSQKTFQTIYSFLSGTVSVFRWSISSVLDRYMYDRMQHKSMRNDSNKLGKWDRIKAILLTLTQELWDIKMLSPEINSTQASLYYQVTKSIFHFSSANVEVNYLFLCINIIL